MCDRKVCDRSEYAFICKCNTVGLQTGYYMSTVFLRHLHVGITHE